MFCVQDVVLCVNVLCRWKRRFEQIRLWWIEMDPRHNWTLQEESSSPSSTFIITIINPYPKSLPPYHHNYLTNDINVIKIIKCISGLSKNEKNPFSNHLQPQSTNTVKLIFIILPRDPYIYIFIHIILTSQPRSLDVWYQWCDCRVKRKDACISVFDPF